MGEGIQTLDFNIGKVAKYSKALPFLKETIPFFIARETKRGAFIIDTQCKKKFYRLEFQIGIVFIV